MRRQRAEFCWARLSQGVGELGAGRTSTTPQRIDRSRAARLVSDSLLRLREAAQHHDAVGSARMPHGREHPTAIRVGRTIEDVRQRESIEALRWARLQE